MGRTFAPSFTYYFPHTLYSKLTLKVQSHWVSFKR
ncbi:Uncharacterised protein [uncultured Avibacterium sp.]|uniref:Uncharacterized protein n=1 Tax=uncultured Avibacterium sp. TaxID=1936169 RepID=A0A486XEX0_9PAST|nr:Uncharacterised protein [uncultured Avibacterium sp.]